MLIPIISSSSTINKPIDEKYIPDTIARIEDIPKQTQANWDMNDPADVSYIENRPFYDSRVETPLLVDYSFTIAKDEEYHKINPAPFMPDVVGKEIDGVTVFTKYSIAYDTITTTDVHAYDTFMSNSDERFKKLSVSGCEIRYYDDTDFRIYGLPGNHKISVSILEEGNLSQIQEKFIPETITRSEYIKQLVGTTCVSEQISKAAIQNRSDWNVDDSSNITYIKNRPFYDTREEKMVMTDYSFTIAEGEQYHSATETFTITTGVEYSIVQNGIYSEKVKG